MSIFASFTTHPASVGETYGQHLRSASGFGLSMIAGGFACIVHAVVPGLFETTASRMVRALHERMVTNRARRLAPHVQTGEGPAPALR